MGHAEAVMPAGYPAAVNVLLRRPETRRLILHSAVLSGLIFAAYIFVVSAAQRGSLAFDVVAYWGVDLAEPYRGLVGDLGFFAYAPPIAALLYPFTQLPWLAFVVLWYALLLAALVWLGRRDVIVLLAFPPVAVDLYHGNIHLLLAAAVVLGFRFPAAWSLILLTKVTPGIGLLWFAVRREWRQLMVALGATAAIVVVSALFLPIQWFAYLSMLIDSAGVPPPWPALPIPLWLRLPLAAAVVWWGARRDARWTVPVGAALALPALWPGGLALLAACWPLRSRRSAPAEPGSPDEVDMPDAVVSAQEVAEGAFSPHVGGYHAADAHPAAGADVRPSTA